mmetsp:Transcript_13148/g.22247  ORF Transcript_13148/g.22247 Transcript_13148/m.22247 type:complete len:214 (+) Transcript_13148:1828-2469(+)
MHGGQASRAQRLDVSALARFGLDRYQVALPLVLAPPRELEAIGARGLDILFLARVAKSLAPAQVRAGVPLLVPGPSFVLGPVPLVEVDEATVNGGDVDVFTLPVLAGEVSFIKGAGLVLLVLGRLLAAVASLLLLVLVLLDSDSLEVLGLHIDELVGVVVELLAEEVVDLVDLGHQLRDPLAHLLLRLLVDLIVLLEQACLAAVEVLDHLLLG